MELPINDKELDTIVSIAFGETLYQKLKNCKGSQGRKSWRSIQKNCTRKIWFCYLMFFDKVSLVTGGFDPVHSGHIQYFKRAKDYSNYLFVGINSEDWLVNKKGQFFQSWHERAEIIRHLNMVDAVIPVPDDDLGSACGAIAKCLDVAETVVFCNGGDRQQEYLELDAYKDNPRVIFEWGVGGNDKINSSSWILKNYFDKQRNLMGI